MKPYYPLKVLELDVTQELPPAPVRPGYRGVHILFRDRRRPVGWATLLAADEEEVISPVRLRQAAEQLASSGANGMPAPVVTNPAPIPISVVVCTRDRTTSLSRCLEALLGLDYPTFEIIVVDNAPTTRDTERLSSEHGVRYVREDRPGLNWARNRGWSEARYPVIAYTDDDTRADRDWLRGLAASFADPAVAAVTGLVGPAELETPAQVHFELGYGGMGKGLRRRRFQMPHLAPRDLIAVQQIGVGANMAFRRETLETVGGFDSALDVGTPAGGAGDLDVFHRILAKGLTIQYEPAALLWHYHRRSMRELWRQLSLDGRSFGVYLIKLWRQNLISRREVARFALVDWGRWLAGRIALGLVGRHRLPLPLLGANLWGMLSAPWAYASTYKRLTPRESPRG